MFVLNELPCSLCAGLRYLVAICKDLGQHYDHYQKKLSKLERVNAARNPTMGQGGALTRIGGPAPGQDNQGGYTPVPEQRAPQNQQAPQPQMGAMAAPAHHTTKGAGGRGAKQEDPDIDEFDDADMDSLLPE